MDQKVLLIVMGALGVVAVVLIIMVIVIMAKNKKQESELGVFVKKGKGINGVFANLYDFLENVPLMRRYMHILSKRYELMYAGSTKETGIITVKLLCEVFLVAAACLATIFGLNPGVYTFATAFIIAYIIGMEIVCASATKLEIKFLKEFDEFICSVKHYYYQCGSVREGIFYAGGECSRMMKGHADQIYKILCSPNVDLASREYLSSGYHKFLKLFLALAELVEENGDVKDEDGSVFLNSIMQLRNDIQADIRYIEKRRATFSGLTLTAGLPLIAVPYIAWWGQDTIPSLVNFYGGHTGFIIKLVLMMLTLICFNSVLRIREGDRLSKKTYPLAEKMASLFPFNRILNTLINRNWRKAQRITDTLKRLSEKYTVRTFYMVKCLYFIGAVAISVVVLTAGHIESRNILLTDVADLSNISTSADGRQIEAMERVVPQYTKWIIDNKFILDDKFEADLTQLVRNEQGIRTDAVATVATNEILTRVKNWRGEYFGWLDIVITVIASMLAFVAPNISLTFRRSLTENQMQGEVLTLQSIIYMLKSVPGTSAMLLLEEMENFSEIFKPSIQSCINQYNVNDREAFENLYLAEDYPGFRRIVDCFMNIDDMGVEEAFEEISSEIKNFKENRELERNLLLDKEAMLANILGVLPGGAILFGYLLVPFIVRSVVIFNSYNQDLALLTN